MNAFEKSILDKTKNNEGLSLDDVEELEKSDLDNIKKLIDERVVPEVEKAVVKSAQIGDVKRNNELLKLLDRLEKSDYLYDP